MDCFFLDMLQKSAKCKTEIIILKDHNKENYIVLYKTQGKTIGLRRSERKIYIVILVRCNPTTQGIKCWLQINWKWLSLNRLLEKDVWYDSLFLEK